jgi:hypothetical protein
MTGIWAPMVMTKKRPTGLVYLQQIKKKAEAESKNCHAKTMLSLEKPIKLITTGYSTVSFFFMFFCFLSL